MNTFSQLAALLLIKKKKNKKYRVHGLFKLKYPTQTPRTLYGAFFKWDFLVFYFECTKLVYAKNPKNPKT